jgi:hypothetical protein
MVHFLSIEKMSDFLILHMLTDIMFIFLVVNVTSFRIKVLRFVYRTEQEFHTKWV